MRPAHTSGTVCRRDTTFAARKTLSEFRLILFAVLLCSSGIDLDAKSPMKAQIARLQKQSPDAPERMEMVRVQIFLDRANFRPGKIDGLGGEFTQKAADRYCQAHGLPMGSRLDVSAITTPYRQLHHRQRGFGLDRPAGSRSQPNKRHSRRCSTQTFGSSLPSDSTAT